MRGRAPGRICLVGEHNDWAGGAAVVVPVDREVRATLTPADRLGATARLDGERLSWTEGQGDAGRLFLVPAVADEVRARWGLSRAVQVELEGDLPPGRGLSSSAACSVALVRAWLAADGRTADPDTVADAAWHAEHHRAGVHCGRLDPLACAWAIPLFLRFSGDAVVTEPLPARFELVVGLFRAPRDTHLILDTLGRYFRGEVPLRDWSAVQRVGAVRGALEGFGAEAVAARAALLAGDLPALGRAMNTCQSLYEDELMTTLPELRAPGLVRATRSLRAHGALGAKFSGAGGEGSVIGLYPPGGEARAGVIALDQLGLDAFVVEVWSGA